jgi:predicted dehydrogenase
MAQIRLVTLAPGHFHAALVQKRAVPGVAARCVVYGPDDADTAAHLARLPPGWEVDVRTGDDWLDRFRRERPGNTVVLSGRNRPKVGLMREAVAAGMHVLADKPWVVAAADLPALEDVCRAADARGLLVRDVMTERHEVTNRLMRELVRDPEVFGDWQAGSPDEPGLVLESVHHLKKTVAGRPLLRPWWWFDPDISGEAMADVGTHLADLAIGFVVGDRAIDPRAEVAFHDADRWPLVLSEEQFRALTGLPGYPAELARRVADGRLDYAGNNTVTFTLGGVHVRLVARWEYEATPGGGDTHAAVARGTRATVSVRQAPGSLPEVFVAAADPADHSDLVRRLGDRCATTDLGGEVRCDVPVQMRTGHEAHFAAVLEEFVRDFGDPGAVPAWEQANTVAKYHVTTGAVERARRAGR